jgi:hypothetical protein
VVSLPAHDFLVRGMAVSEGALMQHPGYGLRRIILPRTPVNRPPADVPFSRIPTLGPRLAEPVLEAGLGESGVVAGQECALVQFYAE